MNTSTYTARNKKYYETHKEKIKQKRQQRKSWLEYYEKNKEKLKSNQRKYNQKKKLIRRKKEQFIPDSELLNLVERIHYTILTKDDEIELDMYTVYKPYFDYIYSRFYFYEDAAMDMFPVLKEHLRFLYEEGD